MKYLGHTIGSGTLAVPKQRITALANYKRPTTKKTLRSFLGCMSYYRRFVDKYADMSALLSPSTSVSSPKSWSGLMTWTEPSNSRRSVFVTMPSLSFPLFQILSLSILMRPAAELVHVFTSPEGDRSSR